MAEFNERKVDGFLEKMGFWSYKRRVYASLFELKEASVSEICKFSRVPLPKIYETVDELEREGFVHLVLAKPRRYGVTSPAAVFDEIFTRKGRELAELNQEKNKILEYFDSTVTEKKRMFELLIGREKVLNFLSHELKFNTSKSYWALVAFSSVSTPVMPMIRRRANEGADVRIVGPEGNTQAAEKYYRLGARVRVSKELKYPVRMSIHDGRRLAFTLMDTAKDYTTLWTDSAPLVANMKNLFNYYWKNSSELYETTK